MQKIEIPFTSQEASVTDPTDVVMTLAMVGGGFAMLFGGQEIGSYVFSRVKAALGMGSDGSRPDLL
jgi:hypothetical protein